MHKNIKTKTLTAALLAALLAGCASLPPGLNATQPYSPTVYQPSAVQGVQQVQTGVIIALQPVQIAASGTESQTGAGLGAVVGGLLGHSVGGGNGKTLATVAGVVAGGLGGDVAAQHVYQQPGVQITVRLDGSYAGTIAVTQAVGTPLAVGERVEVAGSGWGSSPARVLPLPQQPQAVAPNGSSSH
ncbi:MAG: outer membrane lipoprotein [Acidimicrobiales bacterium]